MRREDVSKYGSAGGSGMGLFTVLTLIFVVLKLLGVIAWEWVWVLSPLWISLCLGFVVYIIVLPTIAIFIHYRRRRR